MTVQSWSQTRIENNDADSTINWSESQDASTVTGSARAMMAAVAKLRDDRAGNITTGGTAAALTITTNQTFTSLEDGLVVAARMSADNDAGATLNVDGLGAKDIVSASGTAIGAAELESGSVQVFVYEAVEQQWIVKDRRQIIDSGTLCLFVQATAPTGWTKETTHDDKMLRLVTGAASSGGTTAWSSILTSRTITEAMLPAHTHDAGTFATASDGAHTHTYTTRGYTSDNHDFTGGFANNIWQGQTSVNTSSNGNHTHSFSGQSAGYGNDVAADFDVQYVDTMIASKD